MSATKIEWVKNADGTAGETWNPVTGCTKISAGCANCYAERMAHRLQAMGNANYADGFTVRIHDHVVSRPLSWKKSRMVFVCSMSDLFHEDVPFEFIDKVFTTMSTATQHVFQVLTKRPARMFQWCTTLLKKPDRWPLPNVWLGTSVENQESAAQSIRIPELLKCPAAVKFLSIEPLLGPIKLEWARDIRDQCKSAGVPFFFKKAGTGVETPDDLLIREFPYAD
jgi:protein gp37